MHDPAALPPSSSPDTPTPTDSPTKANAAASPKTIPAREWVCPGVPPRRRLITTIGVVLAAALFFFLAIWQGATMWVSTLIGIVFIGGFVGYLIVIAPKPFTLRLDDDGITRTERGGEPVSIAWDRVAKIKEERFKSGKSVSVAVFKRVGERGLHRAYVVYGDDIPDYDGFRAALRAGVPQDRPWLSETVHE